MGSKGILEGIKESTKASKEVKNVCGETIEKKKRSYLLNVETIKQIEELKLYVFTDSTREQIIEEAVKALYKSKYKGV